MTETAQEKEGSRTNDAPAVQDTLLEAGLYKAEIITAQRRTAPRSGTDLITMSMRIGDTEIGYVLPISGYDKNKLPRLHRSLEQLARITPVPRVLIQSIRARPDLSIDAEKHLCRRTAYVCVGVSEYNGKKHNIISSFVTKEDYERSRGLQAISNIEFDNTVRTNAAPPKTFDPKRHWRLLKPEEPYVLGDLTWWNGTWCDLGLKPNERVEDRATPTIRFVDTLTTVPHCGTYWRANAGKIPDLNGGGGFIKFDPYAERRKILVAIGREEASPLGAGLTAPTPYELHIQVQHPDADDL